ncbi:MAG: Excinuclease ABC subunit A, partial [uncultured Solirubrobacteraceae bacterium]
EAGRHRHLGCSGAQPQGRLPDPSARLARRAHRAFGLGQVVAGVRHDLRGGPAPLRRVAVRLRPAVPRADGQAGRGLDRGPVAGDLDRSEDHVAQPAVDGRHRHGDLRLPAPAVGAGGHPALPDVRRAHPGPDDRADHRPGHGVRGRRSLHGPRAGRARPQGRVRQAARGAAAGGLHARQGRRRAADARGEDRARQEVQARHLRRGRPARDAVRGAQAPGRLGGDRGRAGRGHRRGRGHWRRFAGRPDVLRALRVPVLRHLDARARAADLLVQLAARRVRPVHGPGLDDGDRPRARRARRLDVDRRGRARAVGGVVLVVLRAGHRGDLGQVPRRHRAPVGGPRRRRPGALPLRHQRRPHPGHVPQPVRPPALVRDAVRGDRQQPRAPLQGDGVRAPAREDRGVHVDGAVPGVQGRAAAARVAGGQDRRPRHPRVHRVLGAQLSQVARRGRAHRHAAADRAAHPARDRGAASFPRRRRDRVPVDGPRGGDAVRRRGAAHPPGDADRVGSRRCAVRPRRAVDRPAPARQLQADRHARAAARPRQLGARRRARRADDAGGRLPRRPRARRGRARRRGRRRGHAGAGHEGQEVGDGAVPVGPPVDPGARAPADPERLRRDHRRDPAQPQEGRRQDPARRPDDGHGRVGVGQVDARQRGAVQGGRQQAAPGAPSAGRAQARQGPRAARQDHPGRPGPDRAHPALEPGDLHGPVRHDPRPVLEDAGIARARLQAGALLVQRQGRA